MGRKIRAAQASIVAALLAAGGATGAGALRSNAKAEGTGTIGGAPAINWGDRLIGFMKLDGFPAFFKADNFEALTQFYKEQLLGDAAMMYDKWAPQTADILDLYQKADAGPLAPILSGLEAYWKANDIGPLQTYLKETPGAMDNYIKFWSFMNALQQTDPEGAIQYFKADTGILGNPISDVTDGGGPTT